MIDLHIQVIRRGIETAGAEALDRMTRHYGGGYPQYASGSEVSLAVHNGLHGVEVGHDAAYMAERLGLPGIYVALSKAAGEAHDAILTDGSGNKLVPRDKMEDRTAEYFADLLRAQGVDEDLVRVGELSILGTKTVFSKERYLIAQGVSSMEFPSKEAECVAMSVSCADLAACYGDRGAINILEYYKENRGIQSTEVVAFDPQALAEHYHFEREFLSHYRFPHPLGERLFGSRRSELNDFLGEIEAALDDGAITGWQQLVEQSETYARR